MLAGWLLIHYFLLWLEWIHQAPLLPVDPEAFVWQKVTILPVLPGWVFCRLTFYTLTLPLWLCWLRGFRNAHWNRLTLGLYWWVVAAFCLDDACRWNSFVFLLQFCTAVWLIAPHRAVPHLRQCLAGFLLLACFQLRHTWWLGGSILSQQMHWPVPVAVVVSWLILFGLLVGVVRLSLASQTRHRLWWILPVALALFYALCLGGNGSSATILALGLSWILLRSSHPYSELAHTLGAVTSFGVLTLVFFNPWLSRLLPAAPLDGPSSLSARYVITLPDQEMNIFLERKPIRGWLAHRDTVQVGVTQRGREVVPVRPVVGPVRLGEATVFDTRRLSRAPSTLLQTSNYHTSWGRALLQRHPQWRVQVNFQRERRQR